MRGRKILAILVMLALAVSTMTVVEARRYVKVDGSGNALWILSNDGFGSQEKNLTCGEIITLYITNNSLTKDSNYKVRVWTENGWQDLKTDPSSTKKADDYGDLAISFHVPGWDELGENPIAENADTNLGPGEWNISLFDYDNNQVFSDLNITIKIGNLYLVKFYAGNDEIDHLIYNKYYPNFRIKIYNWTGTDSGLVLAEDDTTKYKFNVVMHNYTTDADPFPLTLDTDVTGGITDENEILIDSSIITDTDKEKTFWVNVSHSDTPSLYSNVSLPVLLNLTMTSSLENLVWGDDSFNVKGKLLDGDGDAVTSYTVQLYCPTSGGYKLVDEDTISSMSPTGTFSMDIETDSDKGYSAGTWYVGTNATGTGRVDMSDQPPYISGFIPYYSFPVEPNTITVGIENSDDIVKGFMQTINVSVKNETWTDDEFKEMNSDVTGIKGWYNNHAWDKSDIVVIDDADITKYTGSDKKAYYEFDYYFNETGTATIWVSWPGNVTDADYLDSSYSNTYGNHSTSLKANITGSTTFSVVSPGAMTVIVDHVPDAVEKEDAVCGGGWVNVSTAWTNISVYGSTEKSCKNATIKVSGCGLDFTIKENDTDNEYLIDYGFNNDGGGAWYNVSIIPKIGGTLTITVTNGTNTVTKDYTVSGLTGSVSTSVGDDLKITVGTTETITLTGVNEYAETKITFFNEGWDCLRLLNESDEPGESSFTPDADDIDQVGYIVVVSGITAYDYYMYEIIDVVPVDDLTVNVTTPDVNNQTLTVGLEQD
ncbi:MAG: hypothetical protein DRP55_09615, partial [Spirochaetes bacterium]